MDWSRTRGSIALIAIAFGATCCERGSDALSIRRPDASVKPMCQAGCQDLDPSPDSPGVFLGQGARPTDCFGGAQNDVDQDGVGDFCENRVALAFAPQLVVSTTDMVGREPRWAMRVVSNDGPVQALGIFYALSYYVDNGTTDPLCENFFGAPLCRGHYGDSENLIFRVDYDSTSTHWVLTEADLSQHGAHQNLFADESGYVSALAYPLHPGGAPRIWVAYSKHANYASVKSCDRGAYFHMDLCQAPFSYTWLGVDGNGDLGSSTHHLIDCVSSTNPLYSGNGQECYWSASRFSGWQFMTPDCEGYGTQLSGAGF